MAGLINNGAYSPYRHRDTTDPRAPLTLEDFIGGSPKLPVFEKDYRNQRNLLRSIYLSNRTGCRVVFAGTSHATSTRDQAQADPSNYEMEFRAPLGNGEWTKVSTQDSIEVVWSYHLASQRPGQWIGAPAEIVTSPNNKTGLFRKTLSGVQFDVSEDARSAPNSFSMQVENSDLTVKVSIFKHYEIGGNIIRSPDAVKSFLLTNTSQDAEYIHSLVFKVWVFNELKQQQSDNLQLTSGVDYTEALAARRPSDTFRVGDNVWEDALFGVKPGSYVVAVADPKQGPGAISLQAVRSVGSPNIVPDTDYISQI